MDLDRLFESQLKQSRMLEEHGFSQWPDLIALTQYAMELSDRIDTITRYLDISIEKDYRGRWDVCLPEKGANDG